VQTLPVPTPLAPTGTRTAHTTADCTPTFTWTTVTGADSYEVWVDDNGNELYDETIEGATSGSWTPSAPLSAGDTFTWWVKAHNSKDNNASVWSDSATFTLALETPILVSPSGNIHSATPSLTWNPVPFADAYYVWLTDNTSGDTVTGTVKSTTGGPNGSL